MSESCGVSKARFTVGYVPVNLESIIALQRNSNIVEAQLEHN